MARHRVVGAAQFGDVAFGILNHLLAFDEVRVAQTHFAARRETEELLGRLLHEIVAFDVDHLREGNLTRSGRFVLRIVDRREEFRLVLVVVGDDHFQRVEYGHATLGDLVQVFADAVFQLAEVDDVVAFGNAYHFSEVAHRSRGVTLAAQGADGRHAGVVPAHHGAFLH